MTLPKSKVAKPAKKFLEFLAHRKNAASLLTAAIAAQNTKGLKGVDCVNPAAASLGHAVLNRTYAEMEKLYFSDRRKFNLYFSDKYDCLPLQCNNPFLACMLHPSAHLLTTEQVVSKYKSTITRHRKALSNIGFIERTQRLSKVEVNGQIITKSGGRAGFILWIPKKFFGITVEKPAANAFPSLEISAFPSASNPPYLVPNKHQSLQLHSPLSNVSLEIEDKGSGVFFSKRQEDAVLRTIPVLTLEKDNTGICNKRIDFPPVAEAPQTESPDGEPSEAANTNRDAQSLTLFGEKLAEQLKSAYGEAAKRQQVVAFKGQPIDERKPLNVNQLRHILPQIIALLKYFGAKMTVAAAFELLTKSIAEVDKNLAKYDANFIYLPSNFLSLTQNSDGTFKMQTGSLRHVAENWNMKDKRTDYVESPLKDEIIKHYFPRLAKYGLLEHAFKAAFVTFVEQKATVSADGFKLSIEEFLGKNRELREQNKPEKPIAYLFGIWRNGWMVKAAPITKLEAKRDPSVPTAAEVVETQKRQASANIAKNQAATDEQMCADFMANNPERLAETLEQLNRAIHGRNWSHADFDNLMPCRMAVISAWKKTV
jgi:hypothetical protein